MSNGAPYPYEPPPGDDRHAGTTKRPRPRARRSRARTFVPLAIAAWAVLEIWLLMLVADAAGGLTVLALLVAGFVLGAVAIKRAGRRAWRNLAETLQQSADRADGGAGGTPPAARTGGGNSFAMLGGLLLIIPGFASDVLALLCLFPPTAALLRRGTERLLTRGELGEAVRQARTAGEQVRMHRPDGKVVQGEVIRDDEPPTR